MLFINLKYIINYSQYFNIYRKDTENNLQWQRKKKTIHNEFKINKNNASAHLAKVYSTLKFFANIQTNTNARMWNRNR